jgi:hypothetical protein
MKTWTLTFRMDFEDEQKYDIMKQMARESARVMLATSMLLKDTKREPRITLTDFDAFDGETVIDINEDIVTTL